MSQPTFIDLCCGYGGMTLGFIRDGWRSVGGVDFNHHACESFKNYIDAPNFEMGVGDFDEDIEVDAVIGGPPCFVAGTLVMTLDGMKPIEDVSVGEMVLTHERRWRTVTAIGNRATDEVIDVKIGGVVIGTTPEHPFWVLSSPKGKVVNNKSTGGRSVWVPREFSTEPEWVPVGEIDRLVQRPVMVLPKEEDTDDHDDAFWWIIGCYLAEGWVLKDKRKSCGISGVVLSCNTSEVEHLCEKIRVAGFNPCLGEQVKNASKITIYNLKLARFVSEFGHGASNKTIPGWVLSLPQSKAKALLDGYFWGDGCVVNDQRGNRTPYNRCTTVSKKLALSVGLLAQRAYGTVATVWECKRPSTCVIEGRVVNQRNTWQVITPEINRIDKLIGNYGTKRVLSVTPSAAATVYNLAVDEDESYTANGFVVHNCQPNSLSGNRLGMRDPRAKVYFDFVDRVARWRPKVVVIENVVGMLSAADADGVKGGALQHFRGTMMNEGYTVVHSVLNAYDYGVPQTRQRVFIVASRDGHMWILPRQWPKDRKLTVYDAFCDLLGQDDVDLPNHKMAQHGPDMLDAIRRMREENRWSLYEKFAQSWSRLSLDQPAPTQTENHGGLCLHPLEPRVITPREMARLQTFPDDWEFLGPKTAVLVQIGNAVPVQLAREVASSVRHLLK